MLISSKLHCPDLCAVFQEGEEFGGGVPVADGHVLVDGQGDNAGEAALGGAAGEAGEVEYVQAGGCLVYAVS